MKTFLLTLCVAMFTGVHETHASALEQNFSVVAENPENTEQDINWFLTDAKSSKITPIEGSLGGPQILHVKKQNFPRVNLWFVEYSSGMVGTSVLSQLDYLVLLKEETAKPGVYKALFVEPIRLTRWKGTQVVYKKNRSLGVQWRQKKIKLGNLDEFSPKTIEIF